MSRRVRTLFPLSLLAHCLIEYKQCVVFSQSMRQRMGAKTTKKKITLVSMPKPKQLDRGLRMRSNTSAQRTTEAAKKINTGLTIEETQLISTICCNPLHSVSISFLHFSFSLSIVTRPLSTEALYRETCDDKSTGVKVLAAAVVRTRARCWLHCELIGGFDVLNIEG